jgi:hypothetical protein
MVRKGVAVWILGSLTFLAGLHALDGFLWLIGNVEQSVFLSLYPFTSVFGYVEPVLYLLGSLIAMFLLWGGTTLFATRNPIETFLGKVLEDGRRENQQDVEFLEAKTSILEMMSETIANNGRLLSGLRDVVFNVRSEVLGLESLNKTVETIHAEVDGLKKMMKRLEKEIKKYKTCPACGRDILVDFRLCPYCGENLLRPPLEERIELVTLPARAKRKKST